MRTAEQYLIVPLDATTHRRSEFICEFPDLTAFLQTRARKEMEARTSACLVIATSVDPGRIVGYYTLSQASVSLGQLPESLSKRLPRYPELGVTLIGRLARDIQFRGQGIGGLLLVDALRRSARLSNEAGAVGVVADPKDTKSRAFYEVHGFQPLDDCRMFISMKDILEWDCDR